MGQFELTTATKNQEDHAKELSVQVKACTDKARALDVVFKG
jgi:hypothetical protein